MSSGSPSPSRGADPARGRIDDVADGDDRAGEGLVAVGRHPDSDRAAGGDAPEQRLVDLVGELARAGDAFTEPLEDAGPQRVRQRLGDPQRQALLQRLDVAASAARAEATLVRARVAPSEAFADLSAGPAFERTDDGRKELGPAISACISARVIGRKGAGPSRWAQWGFQEKRSRGVCMAGLYAIAGSPGRWIPCTRRGEYAASRGRSGRQEKGRGLEMGPGEAWQASPGRFLTPRAACALPQGVSLQGRRDG